MKIIDAKCPGCGANVKFNEGDTKSTCEYCKKEFYIKKDPQEEFLLSLNEFGKDVYKKASFSFKIIGIISLVIVLFVFAIIGFGIYSVINNKDKPLTEFTYIDNNDYSFIDSEAESAIFELTFGDNEFMRIGKPDRVKEYIAYNDENNIYIPVYKVIYADWPKKENKYTIYIPVRFKDVTIKDKSVDIFNLGKGEIDAEDYYFNLEHSSSTKGYQSIDDLYTKYISPLEKDYTIKEK